MAITSYAELKTAVARWTGGSDVSDATSLGFSSTIDDIVTIAETRIAREARTKDNEASVNTAIASGVVAVPSDYVAMRYAYVDGTPVQTLERRSSQWIYENYPTRTANGKPKYFGRDSGNFVFGPYPDSGYTFIAGYYKKLVALSTTAHAMFTNNPDLYLFGCLAESSILIGEDKRIPLWESKYQMILAQVNGMTRAEAMSGSPLQMR